MVEGLALRIAAGEVPPSLQEVILRVLDLGLLQAGASMKGRVRAAPQGVIAVRNSAQPIILFIDEAHTLIGAGGAEGGSDAANLLCRPWRAANCAPWRPPPGWNTRNTSRRTRR